MFHIQIGEVWSEICAELKEEFRPLSSDEKILQLISKVSENTGRTVIALQNEALERQLHRKIQEEKKTFKGVRQRGI